MYICLCRGVTDHQIQQAIEHGSNDIKSMRKALGVACQCCKCLPEIHTLLKEHQSKNTSTVNFFFPTVVAS